MKCEKCKEELIEWECPDLELDGMKVCEDCFDKGMEICNLRMEEVKE